MQRSEKKTPSGEKAHTELRELIPAIKSASWVHVKLNYCIMRIVFVRIARFFLPLLQYKVGTGRQERDGRSKPRNIKSICPHHFFNFLRDNFFFPFFFSLFSQRREYKIVRVSIIIFTADFSYKERGSIWFERCWNPCWLIEWDTLKSKVLGFGKINWSVAY